MALLQVSLTSCEDVFGLADHGPILITFLLYFMLEINSGR